MFENLNQPYPFNNNFKHNVKTIGLVGMGFVLLVLYFQPFGINFLRSERDGYFVLGMGMLGSGSPLKVTRTSDCSISGHNLCNSSCV